MKDAEFSPALQPGWRTAATRSPLESARVMGSIVTEAGSVLRFAFTDTITLPERVSPPHQEFQVTVDVATYPAGTSLSLPSSRVWDWLTAAVVPSRPRGMTW